MIYFTLMSTHFIWAWSIYTFIRHPNNIISFSYHFSKTYTQYKYTYIQNFDRFSSDIKYNITFLSRTSLFRIRSNYISPCLSVGDPIVAGRFDAADKARLEDRSSDRDRRVHSSPRRWRLLHLLVARAHHHHRAGGAARRRGSGHREAQQRRPENTTRLSLPGHTTSAGHQENHLQDRSLHVMRMKEKEREREELCSVFLYTYISTVVSVPECVYI